MDSSVSPTHGEQENSVWNGRYACTCYHPASIAWLLGHHPTRRVIVVSYSNDFAAELHRQFRMVIDAHWYRALFPDLRPAKDSGTELVTTLGGSRYATSVGGTLTGRGADLIIVDDPLKAEEFLGLAQTFRRKVFAKLCANTHLATPTRRMLPSVLDGDSPNIHVGSGRPSSVLRLSNSLIGNFSAFWQSWV